MPSGNRPILRKTHLLVIGINDYEHLEKLQNAVGDAMKIAEVFKKRYGVDNITALYNEEATKERVEAALVQLQQSVSANDNLIIYYSGHGEDRALMPVNAQKNLANTHLRHATFKDYLADIKCHHLLLMVDACYAASIVKERGEREEQGIETADERQSRWAVFSSPHDRKASDGIAHQHSPFAQGVLDILQTNTEAQSLFKFYDELCPRVEQAYKQMGIKSAVRPDIGKLLLGSIDNYGQFVFKPKLTESEAWQRALKINTQAEFERFLALFPNSSKQEAAHWHLALLAAYGDEAHTVFDQFLQLFPTGTYAAEARAKRHQLLQNRWDKIKDTGQLDPIEAFVNTFGKEQPFFAEAEECYWALLRQLRLRSNEDPKYYADKLLVFCRLFPHSQDLRTAQQQHEDALWDWARATDTEDAYIAFIAACPTAPFVGDAQKRLQAARSRSSHRETELRYRSALDRYENAILRRNLAQAQQYLQEAKRLWESDFTPDFYEKAYGVFCDSVVSSNRSKALSPQEEKEIYELGKAAIDKIECFDWRTWLENTRQQVTGKEKILQQQKKEEKYHSEIKMIFVEGGSFVMGNTKRLYETPIRNVSIEGFYISEVQIPEALYNEIMEGNDNLLENKGNYPIKNVSWFDAIKFCNALSQKEMRELVYTINGTIVICNWNAKGYRLPTEAEWEYAARGGKNKDSYAYSGSNNIDDIAWYSKNSDNKVHSIKSKKPNGLGLYCMSGNVQEWCWDWYGTYNFKDIKNPKGAAHGERKVLRGGACYLGEEYCQVSYRNMEYPSYRDDFIGFRLVLVP